MYMKIIILLSIIFALILTMRLYSNSNYENFENGDLNDDERVNMNDTNESSENETPQEETENFDQNENTDSEDPIPNEENNVNLKINNYDSDNDNEKQLEMTLPMSLFKEDHGEFCKCDKCLNNNNEYHVYLHHTINDITKRKKCPKIKKTNNNDLMSEDNINFFLKTLASSGSSQKNKKGKLTSYGTKVPKHIRKLLKQPKFSRWHSPTGLIEHYGPLPANEHIL